MKRINLTFTERQFKKIVENAETADLKNGTFCKLCVLSAIGFQYLPENVILPKKIKQLNLFEGNHHD